MQLNPTTGWLEDVRQVSSPNCDDRPNGVSIDLLVIHSISLPPGKYGGDDIERFFTNTLQASNHPYFAEIVQLQVSAHALIRRDGDITQFVPFHRRAWHAGESCFGDRTHCNDFSIGIELEGCDHDPFEPVQYERLTRLSHQLMQHWPGITLSSIVGHADIAPGRKTDPGPGFEWERFRAMLLGNLSGVNV